MWKTKDDVRCVSDKAIFAVADTNAQEFDLGVDSRGETVGAKQCGNNKTCVMRQSAFVRVRTRAGQAMLCVAFLLLALVFSLCSVGVTFCGVLSGEAGKFNVNFKPTYDVSGARLEVKYWGQAQISSGAVKNIESIAKKEFGNKYKIALMMNYQLFDRSTNERLTDFSNITSVETRVEITGGQPNTAVDAYCAVFVKLDSASETQVLGGNYTALETADGVAKTVQATATDENSLNLKIDASTDGFVFILSIEPDGGNNLGTILVIVGGVAIILIIALMIYTMRSNQLQRRRRAVSQQMKGVTDSAVTSEKVSHNFEQMNAKNRADSLAKSAVMQKENNAKKTRAQTQVSDVEDTREISGESKTNSSDETKKAQSSSAKKSNSGTKNAEKSDNQSESSKLEGENATADEQSKPQNKEETKAVADKKSAKAENASVTQNAKDDNTQAQAKVGVTEGNLDKINAEVTENKLDKANAKNTDTSLDKASKKSEPNKKVPQKPVKPKLPTKK